MTRIDSILLELVRVAVGGSEGGGLSGVTAQEWKQVVYLAFGHRVSALAWDGYQKWVSAHPGEAAARVCEEWEDERLDWVGEVMVKEEDAARCGKCISSLARLYERKGIEMMVLKGWGLAQDWPVPEHRSVGDIDIYLFGRWREGDELAAAAGAEVDYGEHHHSVFRWKGFVVENHYDIIDRYASRDGAEVDTLLKDLALKGRRKVTVNGARVFLPSANFNGIFLLSHTADHFAGNRIMLRHLVDWAMFVDREWRDIDWKLVVDRAERMGMLEFLSCLNGLCVEWLGIPVEKFPGLCRDGELESRVLEDVFHPAFQLRGSGWLFMLRRLRANMWKRKLVMGEAVLPALVRLWWSHMVTAEWRMKS